MRIRPAGLMAGVTLVFGFMSVSAISSRVSPKLPGPSGYHVASIPIGGAELWDLARIVRWCHATCVHLPFHACRGA